MKIEDKLLSDKIKIIDKIKNTFRKIMGYQEGKRFMIDIKPTLKQYTDIKLMKIANIEEKLKEVLEENIKNKSLIDGIKENEAEILLEWTVQNAREGLEKAANEKIKDMDFLGYCGVGQGITGFTLQNMGLNPNIINVNPTFGKNVGRHAFVTVRIPIKNEEGNINNKLYLVDTTYKQFFLRDEVTISNGTYIKDKKFGGKVAPMAGYWVLRMKKGTKFAQELLEKGFIEFTEENAKIYGDGFVLEEKERRDYTKVPTKKEMNTSIEGKVYLSAVEVIKNQEEIDFEREEFEYLGINIKTPMAKKQEMLKNLKSIEIEEIVKQDIDKER